MLGKLLKYDLKYSLKKLSIIYGVIILYSFYTRISMIINNKNITPEYYNAYYEKGISIMFAMFCFLIIFLGSFIVCLRRFWSNLFKGQGYLTFTFPTNPKLIFLSKILNYVCCIIITSIIFVIICFIQGFDVISAFKSFMSFLRLLNVDVVTWFMGVFVIIFSPFFLFCTAISTRFLVSKNKLLISILTFFGILTANSMFNNIVKLIFIQKNSIGFSIISFIISLAFIIIEYFTICWIFEKKLNLE